MERRKPLVRKVPMKRNGQLARSAFVRRVSPDESKDRAWRLAVKQRDGYTCQRCGVARSDLDAHHIASRKQRPDLKYVVSNGVTLCRADHSWCHHNPEQALVEGFRSIERYENRDNE